MTLAGESMIWMKNYLVIDKTNVSKFNGKTITGTYHPTERLSEMENRRWYCN